LKRIDAKVNSRAGQDRPQAARSGPPGSEPLSLPHGCIPSAWSLESATCGSFRLPLCGLLVGRSLQCDLVLDDPDVSRRHAQVMILDTKAWILDLGSANGTLVDGAMVRRERLRESSEIVVGSIRLVVRAARIDDAQLPASLLDDWQNVGTGSSPTRSERLRRLAGAQTCTWADGAVPVMQWADNGRWEEMGPVRRQLVEALTAAI